MADSYATRRKSLDRRQKLLEAMTGAAGKQLGPGQMVGDHFVPTSLFDAFGQLGQAGLAAYGQTKADQQSQELDKERTQILRDALERSQTQNPQEQVGTLMGSELPELQQMGMKAFEAGLVPDKPETFRGLTTVTGPDGKPMLVQAGSQGSIKPVEGYGPGRDLMAVRGELIDKNSLQSYGMFGEAPKGNTTNVINQMPGQLTADEDYAKGLAKERSKSDSSTIDSLGANDAIDQYLNGIQQVLNEGATTGGAANALSNFNNMLTTFGVEISPEMTNTAEGRRQLSAQLADRLSGSGAARLTDKDLKVIENSLDVIGQPNPQKALDNIRRDNRFSRVSKQRMLERSKGYFQGVKGPKSLGSEGGPAAVPRVGEIQDGYQFMGGDPSKPESWRKR